MLKGKTVAIDATTLEANAAMRSIVRRDTGESYQEFLTRLAKASGIETPTREDLARLDRKRKKKTSNKDWTNPHDPDAKVTKMKDGRTHLAHKAEHAVDLETGAIVAVTLQGADAGDTTTIVETATAAADQIEDAQADVDEPQALEEIIADKGYHSNQTMVDLDAVGMRSYIAEPDRGRRDWSEEPEAQAPVYGNRRRIRGPRGRRLMRRRGETIERSFAHVYDTGGMRRTHLRGHTNILKRLLIHAGGFNLGLVMRHSDRRRHAARAAGPPGGRDRRRGRALDAVRRPVDEPRRATSHSSTLIYAESPFRAAASRHVTNAPLATGATPAANLEVVGGDDGRRTGREVHRRRRAARGDLASPDDGDRRLACTGFAMFSVLEKASGRWVGRLGPWMPEGWPGTEVGWAIVRDCWGQGFAPEGADRRDRLGVRAPWLDRRHPLHRSRQLTSQRVARKLGSRNLGPGRLPPPFTERPWISGDRRATMARATRP